MLAAEHLMDRYRHAVGGDPAGRHQLQHAHQDDAAQTQWRGGCQGWLQGEDFEIVAIDLQPGGVKIQLRGR